MNDPISAHAAEFVRQRMEMGEGEWYFTPPPLKNETAQPPKSSRPGASVVSGKPQKSSGSTSVKKDDTCASGDIPLSAIQGAETLESLYQAVCGCLRCPLGKTRTNFVFGDGNPNADIMFIGEAPGADEDAQGLPFVGRAGKLLTKMINAIKCERQDVYIGNILKCRPPQNRDPQAGEIEACEPILLRQIDIIKPKVICALGRISAQTLLRTKSTLSALRGTVHDYHGVKLIVTYHPAALLRNPNWKRPAWEDLKFLRHEYDGLEL
jgi:DNA polymerase